MERTAFGEWDDCVRLTNGEVEIVATTAVGPRIARFGFIGGANVFAEALPLKVDHEHGVWQIRGGHRLWHSPEYTPRTYEPDNDPVHVSAEDGAVILTPPVEPHTLIQKEIEVAVAADAPSATVTHRLTNCGVWPVELAPWAITVMQPGGMAVTPLPTRSHPDQLLPNRVLVLWPYTDVTDARIRIGKRYVTLQSVPGHAQKTKVGIMATDGWALYANAGLLFVKTFAYQDDATYPDYGCSVEMFTNDRFLELETLGPLTRLEPGQTATHVEHWHLFRGADLGASEDDIATATAEVLRQIVSRR